MYIQIKMDISCNWSRAWVI